MFKHNALFSGSGFVEDRSVVVVGDNECHIINMTESEIICDLQNHPAGEFPISVFVDGKGYAKGTHQFEYKLEITKIWTLQGKQ